MHEVGFIERMPRMVAAQAPRANPIARAWSDGGRLQPQKIGYTVAEGLAAGNPGRKGEWELHLLREHGGLAGHAEDEEILAAQRLLARTEGIWAGPTGAGSLAGLARLPGDKRLDPGQTIAVIVSETGLKTEAELPPRAGVAFDDESLRRLVLERLRPQQAAEKADDDSTFVLHAVRPR